MTETERDQVVAFLWATDRAVAEAVTPLVVSNGSGADCHAAAWMVSDGRHPLVWDANYVYVQRTGSASAEVLAHAADWALRRPNGAPGGGVVIAGEADGERLAESFAQLGWRAAPLLLMVHRDSERRGGTAAVRQLTLAEARGPRRAVILSESWGNAAVAEQILSRDALGSARWTEWLRRRAQRRGGQHVHRPAPRGDRPARRRRHRPIGARPRPGPRRCVVRHRTGTQRSALVFLCADALDWPRHVYARLGYEPIGLLHRFFPVL